MSVITNIFHYFLSKNAFKSPHFHQRCDLRLPWSGLDFHDLFRRSEPPKSLHMERDPPCEQLFRGFSGDSRYTHRREGARKL